MEIAVPPTHSLEDFLPGQQLRGASGRTLERKAEPPAQDQSCNVPTPDENDVSIRSDTFTI
jgi:hypothetical protein